MNIPECDRKLFFHLYHSLLLFINKTNEILEELHSPDDIFKLDLEDIQKIKDNLYTNPHQIDSFVKNNPSNFTSEELGTISSWKHFVKGRFYVVRYLKNYAVFMDDNDPPKAYGVMDLITPLEEMMGPNLPRVVDAVLLPFKNNIIYDGTLSCFNLFFGPGMRKSINDSFIQAKTGFGIVTSLPVFSGTSGPTDSEKLRGFLRSKDSRDIHWGEIEDLRNKSLELMAVYSEEMGRVHARAYRKKLKEIGVIDGWFGLIDGMIIASGRTQNEVEMVLGSLLPTEKIKFAHIFHLKAR